MAAATRGQANHEQSSGQTLTQKDRHDEKFWECRRSLRLWPVKGACPSNLEEYLKEWLDLDGDFVKNMGGFKIRCVIERKPQHKDEVIVTFEEKAVRDAIKTSAHRLAEHRNEAGMRLHIPDHLQKKFRALMNLSYDLKKKNPDLKRSVKSDEDKLDMFMDIQTVSGGDWRRVESEQAVRIMSNWRAASATKIGSDELDGFLEETDA